MIKYRSGDLLWLFVFLMSFVLIVKGYLVEALICFIVISIITMIAVGLLSYKLYDLQKEEKE